MAQPEAPTVHVDAGEDLISRVEIFLDNLAKSDETEKGVGNAASSLAENLDGLGLSQAEGGAKPKSFALQMDTPPFSDFVSKVGKPLDKQEQEHKRRKHEQVQKMLLKEKLSNKDEFADEDDINIEGNGDEISTEDLDADNALLAAQMNSPSLSKLIFGENPSLDQEYNPTQLKELLEMILPKDGAFVEDEGVPMSQDNSPVMLEPGKSLAPDKVKILHEMLGLYGAST